MSAGAQFPVLGFVRGAIVRHSGVGPNMLVARSFSDGTTGVIVCEGPGILTLNVRLYPTCDLTQVLPANGYAEGPPEDLMGRSKAEVPFA